MINDIFICAFYLGSYLMIRKEGYRSDIDDEKKMARLRRERINDGDIRVSYLARTHGGGFSEREAITGVRPRTDISICALSSNPL